MMSPLVASRLDKSRFASRNLLSSRLQSLQFAGFAEWA
jgi:hypothetical protein